MQFATPDNRDATVPRAGNLELGQGLGTLLRDKPSSPFQQTTLA